MQSAAGTRVEVDVSIGAPAPATVDVTYVGDNDGRATLATYYRYFHQHPILAHKSQRFTVGRKKRHDGTVATVDRGRL